MNPSREAWAAEITTKQNHDEPRTVAMETIKETSKFLTHWVCSWNHQDWFIALAMTVVVGALMLRGFGSRNSY